MTSLVVLLLVALAVAWAGARVLLGYGPRDPARRQLAAREARFFAAAADAAFPPGGQEPAGAALPPEGQAPAAVALPHVPEGQAPAAVALPHVPEGQAPAAVALPSGTEAGIVGHLDGWLDLLPRRNRALIRLLVLFFEHATLAFPAPGRGGRRRFSALALEQRIALLEDWGRSRLRLRRIVFASLRTLLTSSYFASPAVLRATGLAPLAFETPVVEADLLYPPVGRPRSEIRWRREDLARPQQRAPLDPHGPLHPAYAEERR